MKTLLLLTTLLLSSCNLTVDPDGTRNWTLNREAARAIIIHAAK